MAEFKNVIKQQKRMCEVMKDCYDCPLRNMDFDCRFAEMIDADYDEAEVEAIERIVMDWAAKNPESRCPTWAEWLRMLGVVRLSDIIPADIAEKLGIKPVGGADDENA